MPTSRCVVQAALVNLSDTRLTYVLVVMDVKLFRTTWVARTSLFGDRARGGCFFVNREWPAAGYENRRKTSSGGQII